MGDGVGWGAAGAGAGALLIEEGLVKAEGERPETQRDQLHPSASRAVAQ